MNVLNRWNWLKDLEAFQRSRDSLLRRSPTHNSELQAQCDEPAQWLPSMEVSETDQEYLITAELPQLSRNDVKVSAEPGTLSIVGQRKFEPKATAAQHQGPQPICSSFGRAFSLPKDASPARISAELTDGILVVRLVKGEPASCGRVEVQIS